MKKNVLLALVIVLGVPAVVRAAEITAASTITKVTVYQDRVLVTRQAQVELAQGENSVLFEGLPASLMEDSLRAEGQGVSRVTIGGVELKKIFSSQEADPRVAQITQELEKLQDELKELQSKTAALQGQMGFIDSVKNFSSIQVPTEIMTKSSPPSDWVGISKFILDSIVENNAQTLAVEKTIREKEKEVEAKGRELNEINRGRGIEKKTAVVSLDTKDKTSFKIELSYVVPQAAWALSYDAKLDPEKKSCLLISYGNVRQWTGEDWNNVSLTLSSSKPAIGGRMPELIPWFVDFFQRYQPQMDDRRLLPQGPSSQDAEKAQDVSSARSDLGQRMKQAPPEEAVLAQANVSQELASVTFEIVKPVTILSDNRFYKNPVKTESFPVQLDYEATPKLSPYAFIHSKITNDKDYPLLAGQLSLFVNGTFIGKSFIETVGRNEEFDLYLGIDEEIKVKRTELIEKTKRTMLGLRARKDYGYKVELENYKKDKISLTVVDQVPVSKNADIKTELLSSSVKPSEIKDLGILKWKFDLDPKEKKAFEFQFFVEYPSDKNISGI